jgi:hypothetical protein
MTTASEARVRQDCGEPAGNKLPLCTPPRFSHLVAAEG